ncbi:hypothetical protein SDC9_113943 [bioreactor metagenome]|uniref:Uncharacterized protein n=2 Tax=root TaxID=1 RepID=A0A645BP62_9ZZZZ
METVNVLKAAAIVYMLPLLFLLVGTITTYFILDSISFNGNVELFSGMMGLILMLLAFLILKKNDSKFRDSREYIPIVTEVVLKGGSEIKL